MSDSTGQAERKVVITGAAPITPIGIGNTAFWDNIRAGHSAIAPLTRFDNSPYRAKHSAEINDFDPSNYFAPSRLKRLERFSQLAVASARLALEDSGLVLDEKNERVGLSFGSALGGLAQAESEHHVFLEQGPRKMNKSLAFSVYGGAAPCNIALELGIHGPSLSNANSCASGNVALGEAYHLIKANRADTAIAGAAEAPLCPLSFAAFDNINTMSQFQPQQDEAAAHACRPFDKQRGGFVIGEGAASFVLEEKTAAQNRGAFIYAEITGYSLQSEAYHMTSPRPGGAPVASVISAALADAQLQPEQIDYISPHGSSTQLNDRNELDAIETVFGNRKIPLTALKAYTGHSLGAAGAIEIAATLLAMKNNWLPPCLHLDEPEPSDAVDYLTEGNNEQSAQHALCNAFGFGGLNSSLILSRVTG